MKQNRLDHVHAHRIALTLRRQLPELSAADWFTMALGYLGCRRTPFRPALP